MARKPAAKSPPAGRDPVDAALALAAAQGWEGLTMSDIAEAAGIGLGALLAEYPGKPALLAAYARRLDQAMLAEAEDDDSPRDRLFAAIMRRFDAMQPQRKAITAILRAAQRDPMTLGAGICAVRRAARWMLEAAGIDSGGWRGLARRRALAAIYADVFRVWQADDSPDLAKTMARLDQRLKWAESMVRRLGGGRRVAAAEAA